MRTTTFVLCLLALVTLPFCGHAATLRAYRQPVPRVLWIDEAPNMAAYYLASACRWNLTMVQTRTDMDVCYHHIDKAVEYTPEQEKAVQQRLTANLAARLNELDTCQVLVLECRLDDLTAEQQERISAWVAQGGLLVLGRGWFVPADEKVAQANPLTGIMPCTQGRGQGPWFIFFGRPEPNPLVAGVPTHYLHQRNWIQQVAGKPDAIRLTRPLKGDAGYSWWLRPHGNGAVISTQAGVVMGASFQNNYLPANWTQKNDKFDFTPGYDRICRYTDDAALLADLWRQITYWHLYQQQAFPAMLNLTVQDTPQRAAATVQVNFTWFEVKTPQTLQVTCTTPRGEVVYTTKETVNPNMRDAAIAVPIPVSCPWPQLQVTAALIDSAGGDILHQATDFIQVKTTCAVAAKADKPNYQPGEPVRVTVTASSADALTGATVQMVVHDFRGRVFAVVEAPLTFAAAPEGAQFAATGTLNWRFPAAGTGVDQYLFTGDVAVRAGGKAWAYATVALYDGRPWEMRRQFVYAPWNAATHGIDPVVTRAFALERDAGYNGISAHDYGDHVVAWAERQGWRMYAEGLPGPNIWSPLVDTAGREALEEKARKQLAGWAKNGEPNPYRSPAIALVSLGEEPGYKNGWGQRYYWDTPEAPQEAAAVFQWYLKEMYHEDLAALNTEWGTAYTAWEQVPLTKEYSGGLHAGMKKWEEAKKAALKEDGAYLFHLAPYMETARFYDWYFNEIDQAAVRATRQATQPTWKTMFTAGIFAVETDVPNYNALGAFYPKEAGLYGHASWQAAHGDVPGFTASMWDFYDHLPLLSAELWSAAAVGNTFYDSWVDFGLSMNKDFTHTRSSFFKKRWMSAIEPVSKILLDQRLYSDPAIGFYRGGESNMPATPWNPSAAWDAMTEQYSALLESGFRPRIVAPAQFGACKVLVSPVTQVVSPAAADGFRAYVKNGGTLVATMYFAAFTPHGNPLATAPALGLEDLLGFQVDARKRVETKTTFTIPNGAAPLPGGTSLLAMRHDVLTNLAPETAVLATYADGTPAILRHPYGKGMVYYFNFHHDWTKWWNTFYTPEREAYRVLLEKVLLSVPGVTRPYFLRCVSAKPNTTAGWWKTEFDQEAAGRSNPYWAGEMYADPSGKARYLHLFADHRSPVIDARVEWFRSGDTAYDVLTHRPLVWQKTPEGTPYVPVTLESGGGTLLAFLPSVPKKITITPAATSFTAGGTLTVKVAVQESKPAAAFAHSMTLAVTGPDGKPLEGLARQLTITNTASVPLLTACNDPAGTWRITVTDCVTGLQGMATVKCLAGKAVPAANIERWPSETWAAPALTAADFIGMLQRLTETYLTSKDRSKLGYYYFLPGETESRHNLLAVLAQADWRPFTNELLAYLRAGHTLILTGEDLGIDPLSGLKVSAFGSGTEFTALAEVLGKAEKLVEVQEMPTVLVASYGPGRLILDRTSIDAQGWTNAQIGPWHEQWLARLHAHALTGNPHGKPFDFGPLTSVRLRQWLLKDKKERYWEATP